MLPPISTSRRHCSSFAALAEALHRLPRINRRPQRRP